MATLAVAVFYVFYQFLITPEWAKIAKLRKNLHNARLELKVTEGKIELLDKLEEGRVEKKPTMVSVPEAERPLAVLRALAQATTKSRLNLISVRPIIGEKRDEFKFDVVCTGTYQNLYEFLSILHGLDIVVMIDSLRVSGGGGRRPELHMKIVLTAYF
jgi:hypothetical protein